MLGTGSASRREIVTRMGIPFSVRTADIDERSLGDRRSARQLVVLLANKKADAIMASLTAEEKAQDAFLLTADQVVTWEGHVREKPLDEKEARAFLRGYARSPCSTVGSIVLTDVRTGRRVEGVDTTTIHIKPLGTAIIDQLVAEGKVYHCAGALMVEHALISPHIRIEGTKDSAMGLSKRLLRSLVQKLVKELQLHLPRHDLDEKQTMCTIMAI